LPGRCVLGDDLTQSGIFSFMSLLEFTDRGIYCQKAGVFIDPTRGVPKAIITHAHSDHAREGSGHYLCTPRTAPILRHRLGGRRNIQTIGYGESLNILGVRFSFHPAGHIVGSAQVRVKYRDEVWVVSGDYKVQQDNVSEEFELVKCDTFITESTFGLPVYQWPDPQDVFRDINSWWASNSQQGITSVLSAYALGKAQRIVQNIDHTIGPVFCDETIHETNRVIQQSGVNLKTTLRLNKAIPHDLLSQALVLTSGNSGAALKRLAHYTTGAASGWMAVRGRKSWNHVDRGFILSDHVDWQGLNDTISHTGCEHVIVTHGYTDILARWLQDKGLHAERANT